MTGQVTVYYFDMDDASQSLSLHCSPVKPSLVVGGQDSIWASLLEAVDKDLQAADSSSNELGTAVRLQVAVMLYIVLLDQVINAHCWVAVCDIEPTACRAH